jgi:predicted nuclease of restriction endonuclease-like (RecB) superfamily
VGKKKVVKQKSVVRRAKVDRPLMKAGMAPLPTGYVDLLGDLKSRLRTAQIKAALAVNRELIQLYWDIGGLIVQRQEGEAWGTKILDQLECDLRAEFPEMKGLSRSNLFRMRSLYLVYSQGLAIVAQAVRQLETIVPQVVAPMLAQPARALPSRKVAQAVRQLDLAPIPQEIANLPWGHNIVLLEKLDVVEDRLWYARQTTLHGWSRSVLVAQIETQAHKRQGKALTNFDRTLPQPQSDLARQLLKDPYTFEFLALADDVQERQLEQSLLEHLKQFLIELGTGFAFVGNQHHLEVGGDDFYIDLLFYHLKLRCFVAIDLKTEAFQPEHAGKMNFYLAAVDDLLRHESDGPSVGLILCKERNEIVVEYALRDSNRPLGVATYQLLPPELRASLPSPEQLAAEIRKYS